MGLKTFLKGMFTEPVCPRCGQALVEWRDTDTTNGYVIERKWTGCPTIRDAQGNGQWMASRADEHRGWWKMESRRPYNEAQ